MKRLASAAALGAAILSMAACGDSSPAPAGVTRQSFESAEATLVELEFDGVLRASTSDPAAVKGLIAAQVLYSVGSLNADRSVGTYGELELGAIDITPSGSDQFQATYHAKLPVAWGNPDIPMTYELVLPRSAGEKDQIAFAKAYAKTCTDPEGGIVDESGAGRMFLFFRPHATGCALDPKDVYRLPAKVTRSAAQTTGKYPEYRRIWSDGVLNAVYVFSVEHEDDPADAGRIAYDRFVTRAEKLLAVPAVRGPNEAHLEIAPADGRRARVDVRLVGTYLDDESPAFDAWFDAVTPKADLVMYSGHAGLGANVRAFSKKGTFSPGQYVIWAMNGCDTFAYLDRTLAERRALLNPDDPAGTKYMDVVSNALGAWFHAGDDTASAFLRDLLVAGGERPLQKTYRQIFEGIDPTQVALVTGEEDNEEPIAPQAFSSNDAARDDGALAIPVGPWSMPEDEPRASGCSATPRSDPHRSWGVTLLVGLCLVALRRRD